MKIIIPMAGMGKRMRPHTLTVPKPLLPIAGKPIVERLVEELVAVCGQKVEEIGFVTGRFGTETEEKLIQIAERLGAKGSIHYQDEPKGTAHAILCAQELLNDRVIVAFADTLFKANFKMDEQADGVLWVHKVEDPSAFGVVKLNAEGSITEYVEKPKEFVSDLAMIGIYYFKNGEQLRSELQYLIDNNIIKGGEYQLPDALRNMTEKGKKFVPGEVKEWLDCGNKDATVFTNQRILTYLGENERMPDGLTLKFSCVIEPSYIGPGVSIENSIVGPYASIGANSRIVGSHISNSIIGENNVMIKAHLENCMTGNFVQIEGKAMDVSLSSYSTIQNG